MTVNASPFTLMNLRNLRNLRMWMISYEPDLHLWNARRWETHGRP